VVGAYLDAHLDTRVSTIRSTPEGKLS
jgi:hypothetical protein